MTTLIETACRESTYLVFVYYHHLLADLFAHHQLNSSWPSSCYSSSVSCFLFLKGDVIAENFSEISAGQSILIHSFYRNQHHHQSTSNDEQRRTNATTAGTGMHATAIGSSGLKSIDAPFEGGLSTQLLNEFYPLGKIRRTEESTVNAKRFIPKEIEVEVRKNNRQVKMTYTWENKGSKACSSRH